MFFTVWGDDAKKYWRGVAAAAQAAQIAQEVGVEEIILECDSLLISQPWKEKVPLECVEIIKSHTSQTCTVLDEFMALICRSVPP